MSKQEIDDIITCAASSFLRAEYSMDFEYTDLNKVKNFMAFESGVLCFYPAPESTFSLATHARSGVKANADDGFKAEEYDRNLTK